MPSPGDRIVLIYTSDGFTGLKPGEEGTVTSVSPPSSLAAFETINVKWDDGSTLSLLDGEDKWRLLDAPA